MRRDIDDFGDGDLELVHISRRLAEAKAVERLLSDGGVDYAVTAEKYRTTFLLVLPTVRVGAFFYVPAERARACRELLAARRYQVFEDEDEAEA